MVVRGREQRARMPSGHKLSREEELRRFMARLRSAQTTKVLNPARLHSTAAAGTQLSPCAAPIHKRLARCCASPGRCCAVLGAARPVHVVASAAPS